MGPLNCCHYKDVLRPEAPFAGVIKRLKCDAGVGDDVLASCFLAVACVPLHTSGNQSLLTVVVWRKLKRPTDAANVKDEDGGGGGEK